MARAAPDEDTVETEQRNKRVDMESRTHCAYNQTRECFLGLRLTAAEISEDELDRRVTWRSLKSGEGFWVVPFHGIPATDPLRRWT